MTSKEMNMLVKILGLLGAIFVLIAQFVPWGGGAYLFGYSFLGAWDFFYIEIMSTGIAQAILFSIIMIVLFFINLIALILGFLAFKKIETQGINVYQRLAILTTLEFSIYIVGASIASGGLAGIGIFGAGLVLILIAMILYWLTYALGKTLGIYPSPTIHQQNIYQHPQPQMMYPYQQQHQMQQTPVQQPQAQPPPQQPIEKGTEDNAPTPKFCSQCGSPVSPNTKFCSQCGNKL